MELTQAYLKTQLHYDPETGVFTRIASASNASKVGNTIKAKHGGGYALVRLQGKAYLLHRLAFLYMEGEFPAQQVDHINGIRSDNSFVNLRRVSPQTNCRNQKVRRDNASGHHGVWFSAPTNRWHAFITVNMKRKFIGSFPNIEDAINARKQHEHLYGFHPNHGRSA